MDSIIRLHNVTKNFGKKRVLAEVNLEIRKGEIFVIIGVSGSGKTTLLNAIIGFIQPDSGDILFNLNKKYISVFKKPVEVHKKIGFSAQLPSFYDKLTVSENLDYFGAMYNSPPLKRAAEIDSLLKLVNLITSRDVIAAKLSGGMKKRLDIACALIHKPDILILDEPTADLDPVLREQTWQFIEKIKNQGTTVIIASHFLEEVEKICDRIGMLHNGKISHVGTPDELRDIYTKSKEIHLLTSPGKYEKIAKKLNKKRLAIENIFEKDKKLVVYTKKPEQTLHTILKLVDKNKENLIDVTLRKPTLKDIFKSILK